MAKITVSGAKEFRAYIKDLGPKLAKNVINKMAQICYDEAQKGAGRHVVTGAMYQSLFNRQARLNGRFASGREVGHDPNRAPHALFVQFGTRPHVILPKTKKALRWEGPNGFVFAKKVNHPGYRGDPYLVKDARDKAVAAMQRLVTEELRGAK